MGKDISNNLDSVVPSQETLYDALSTFDEQSLNALLSMFQNTEQLLPPVLPVFGLPNPTNDVPYQCILEENILVPICKTMWVDAVFPILDNDMSDEDILLVSDLIDDRIYQSHGHANPSEVPCFKNINPSPSRIDLFLPDSQDKSLKRQLSSMPPTTRFPCPRVAAQRLTTSALHRPLSWTKDLDNLFG